jgi:hypothetical protein
MATLGGLAASILVVLAAGFLKEPVLDPLVPMNIGAQLVTSGTGEEEAILPVARADEVAILRVEGIDTETLVVGQLPLQGLLELASAEEVSVTSMEPAEDNMVPKVRVGARSPMIWARAPSD